MIKKIFKKLISSNKGLATTEAAILLPWLFFTVFMCIVFLLAIYSKIIVVDSAREAARGEALRTVAAADRVNDVIEGGNLKLANIKEVTVNRTADSVEVEVTYNQPSIIPGLPKLIGGDAWGDNIKLKSKSVFKKERP